MACATRESRSSWSRLLVEVSKESEEDGKGVLLTAHRGGATPVAVTHPHYQPHQDQRIHEQAKYLCTSMTLSRSCLSRMQRPWPK
ncbi:unnamed protein product [Allacma fusca]|uniref:Uncharacterized protein n=1 Tax=Allacma fusca TaxID=39272 RepID=A0A8J2LCT4_9HEXA|nr:unnamed protein product [Allacma fusca]